MPKIFGGLFHELGTPPVYGTSFVLPLIMKKVSRHGREKKNYLEMLQCLIEMLITHERNISLTCTWFPAFSTGSEVPTRVGSSDPHRKYLASSDVVFMAS